ncbi:hypothetical protein CRG98_020840 [Punica granatum]|uniref:Uncharacterized protein n=1 Tax=Punica granatum TaxID=22663 RepID=A0A2I0JRC4_PUNGR|nr:hypothetical protein CRG98_020840 [Punica granatum]
MRKRVGEVARGSGDPAGQWAPKLTREEQQWQLRKKWVGKMAWATKGPPFFGSGSTREIKMSSEKQSETCSLVLVTLGCVPACFQVPFICLWIGRPGSPVKKASANVRECPNLSRRLLKCARGRHWSFCPCLRVRMFASVGPSVNSDPSFSQVLSVGAGGSKWGVDSDLRGGSGHSGEKIGWLGDSRSIPPVGTKPLTSLRTAECGYGHLTRNSRKKKGKKGWLCLVVRLSTHDHLVTGESEGREKPLDGDGTTRHSRGREK